MQFLRRELLRAGACVAAFPALLRTASAQAYPTRPVRIVVGFGPGGAPDIVARLLAQWLSDRIGQQFFVEIRSGAGGNLATEAVVKSPADGYTLLLGGLPNAVNATLYDKLHFDFIRDIAPVAGVASTVNALVVNPSVPAKSVPELIAYAKANPGKLNMGSAGIGSPPHMAGELFKKMTGIDLVHVPYRGMGTALSDLLAGQVEVLFLSLLTSIEYIRAGKLNALAVTSAKRSDVIPELPAVSEFVPGYEAITWWGIGAPRNTPREIVNRLSSEINAVLIDAIKKKRLEEVGVVVLGGSPADFEKLIAEETAKWRDLIRVAHITL